MIPYIENTYFLGRKNNVLIAYLIDGTELPIIKFKQKFPDVLILEGQALKYMKDYMAMWPELWENVYQPKPQLTLF